MKYIRRAVEDLVLRTDGTFKAVLLTGARQTGKTEMIKRLFPGRKYVSLDDPFIEEQASENPGMFMMLQAARCLRRGAAFAGPVPACQNRL